MFRKDRHITCGLRPYSRFFQCDRLPPPTTVLESTPAYLYQETAIRFLPDLPTNPRFVFVVREPAEQIYSLYKYFKNNWIWIPKETTFREFVLLSQKEANRFGGNELAQFAIRYADYTRYLRRWRDRVGINRMAVWLFEDLCNDPVDFMRRAATFAGLDPNFYNSYEFPHENSTYAVKSYALQRINVSTRAHLSKLPFYGLLRKWYRQINTTPKSKKTADEQQTIFELRQHFTNANQALAHDFGVDISAWSS